MFEGLLTKWRVRSYTEPLISGYGRFMQERADDINDKFIPFVIHDLYLHNTLASDGYRITLESADEEWILHNTTASRWDIKKYTLTGPFRPGYIKDVYQVISYERNHSSEFPSLDSAMTYLFENTNLSELRCEV